MKVGPFECKLTVTRRGRPEPHIPIPRREEVMNQATHLFFLAMQWRPPETEDTCESIKTPSRPARQEPC